MTRSSSTSGLAGFPDLNGDWDMAIHWVRDGKQSVIVANAHIRHDGGAISMDVKSSGSDSHTILVQPGRDKAGEPLLYYMYEVEPHSAGMEEMEPYQGAAILHAYADGMELSGNYWTTRRSTGLFKLTRRSAVVSEPTSTHRVGTDVLLITALKEEFDAALLSFAGEASDIAGIGQWSDLTLPAATECKQGVFQRDGIALFNIVVARPARMGGIHTSMMAAVLSNHLKPDCLVMCGVCAGNPKVVALGDVVVSEFAYQHDEGRSDPAEFEGDHRQVPISKAWHDAAEAVDAALLPSYGAASAGDARFWLLERLYAGDDPQRHPARRRYFGRGKWSFMTKALVEEGVIERSGPEFHLTRVGVDEVEYSMAVEVDPPERLPIAIKVGPIASGNAVVKDGVTWESLGRMGVRTVAALEMEGAALALVARSLDIPQWIVMKGVMDHADPRKDDRFKPFAARASAEALRAFLMARFVADST
jgi:nucleoside phosphorylase